MPLYKYIDGVPYEDTDPPVVPPTRIPETVSKFQAKAALLQTGMLSTVEALVAQADAMTQLAWTEAQVFERTSPLLAAMVQTLGWTEAYVDSLFITAASIQG